MNKKLLQSVREYKKQSIITDGSIDSSGNGKNY